MISTHPKGDKHKESMIYASYLNAYAITHSGGAITSAPIDEFHAAAWAFGAVHAKSEFGRIIEKSKVLSAIWKVCEVEEAADGLFSKNT